MRRCHHRRAGLAALLTAVLTGATLLQDAMPWNPNSIR